MDNELSKVIGNQINTLLGVQHRKQKELANYLGVTDNTISYFCSGKRTPNTAQIGLIADFFNVSTDYLLGRTDAWTTDKDLKFVCEYTKFSEHFIEDCLSDSLGHNLVNFLNEISSTQHGIWLLESMMMYLSDYRLSVRKITTMLKNKAQLSEEIINERDMCQFRAERDFRELIELYGGQKETIINLYEGQTLGQVLESLSEKELNDNGNDQETE